VTQNSSTNDRRMIDGCVVSLCHRIIMSFFPLLMMRVSTHCFPPRSSSFTGVSFVFVQRRSIHRCVRLLQESRPKSLDQSGTLRSKKFSNSIPLFYNDIYEVKLPPTHRFPMEKYRLVREGLQEICQKHEKVSFTPSPLVSIKDLSLTHTTEYIRRYLNGETTEMENRRAGFPWSRESVLRSLSSTGGTVAAMHAVCQSHQLSQQTAAIQGGKGIPRIIFAGHLAGGTHHAFSDRAEGFCIFSDIAVAANVALRDYGDFVKKILIVDLDVHQGNGNAVLFEKEERVITFSMHCKQNYFSKIEKSDFDVEIEEKTGDHEYLLTLEDWLPQLVDDIRPDLIFYQAGVDGLHSDRLGKLKMTREGMQMRNQILYELALEYEIPVVITMGGGYPKDLDVSSTAFQEVIGAHQDVYLDAIKTIAKYHHATPDLNASISEEELTG